MCHRRAAASLKHTRRDACHCVPAPARRPLGRAPEHIKYCGLPPKLLFWLQMLHTFAARAGESLTLSHGHRQPSCTIYENKRAPPGSGHAWHPPGWRQPRVSCSALSPFSCFLWRTLCACRSDQASFKGLNCCLNMAIMKRQRSARISRHNGSPRNQPPVSSPTDSRSPRARPRQQRPIGNVLKIADSLDLMRQGACNGGRPPVRRAATRPRSF